MHTKRQVKVHFKTGCVYIWCFSPLFECYFWSNWDRQRKRVFTVLLSPNHDTRAIAARFPSGHDIAQSGTFSIQELTVETDKFWVELEDWKRKNKVWTNDWSEQLFSRDKVYSNIVTWPSDASDLSQMVFIKLCIWLMFLIHS